MSGGWRARWRRASRARGGRVTGYCGDGIGRRRYIDRIHLYPVSLGIRILAADGADSHCMRARRQPGHRVGFRLPYCRRCIKIDLRGRTAVDVNLGNPGPLIRHCDEGYARSGER